MRNNQKFSAMKRMALAILLILAGPFCALAQIKVSGKITDETNTPMAGVSIIEIGTQNGAISDVDGNWSLTVSEGASLEFYYLGYVTIRKTATAGTMNVRMEPDTQVLEETVAYRRKAPSPEPCHRSSPKTWSPAQSHRPHRPSRARPQAYRCSVLQQSREHRHQYAYAESVPTTQATLCM